MQSLINKYHTLHLIFWKLDGDKLNTYFFVVMRFKCQLCLFGLALLSEPWIKLKTAHINKMPDRYMCMWQAECSEATFRITTCVQVWEGTIRNVGHLTHTRAWTLALIKMSAQWFPQSQPLSGNLHFSSQKMADHYSAEPSLAHRRVGEQALPPCKYLLRGRFWNSEGSPWAFICNNQLLK